MIDALSIIFSTLMCMFIVLRAVKLDRSLPWYGSSGRLEAAPDAVPTQDQSRTSTPPGGVDGA